MSYSPKLMIKVISDNGASINNSVMLCEFGVDEHITVGRSSTNHLVLDDPSRLVSRVQARLSYNDGSSALIHNLSSSTGLFIDDAVLQPGDSAVIGVSDTLMIGSYILRLQSINSVSNEKSVVDNLISPHGITDEENIIPADFDFFSEKKPLEEQSVFNVSLAGVDSVEGSNPLLDNLDAFSADQSSYHQYKAVSGDRLLMEQSSDPLTLLSDEVKENSLAAYSLGESNEMNSLFFAPRATPQTQRLHHSGAEVELDVLASVKNITAKSVPINKQSAAAIDVNAGLSGEHRQALARGLQMDEGKLPAFTPAFFEVLGGVLLHLTAGTVNMMHERAHIKHEMRADVTIIASSGNNPLKFAPDAQSALVHLIGDRVPGFMHSVEAIDDAFDDLLAHQIGMMSGARAAVYDVVKGFNPEKIHKYMANKNFIDSLLPMAKKSKLWELYETHYAEVAGNAQEDFELRFQQAFSQAYEQEIDRMCEARERA